MIYYFIRTTGERQLDSSYSQIEYKLLVDTEHKPVESFIKQLDIISEYDSVLLEDDLILCKDFKNRIEEVINEYPNMIINFFQLPSLYITTCVSNLTFRFNQCTYYPKGVSKKIAENMLTYDKSNYKYGYDVIEDWAFKKLEIIYLIHRPCLVQHNDFKSIIQNGKYLKRTTPYFIDYLEELGISYEDAVKVENQVKLRNLMKEKFKEIDSK